MQITRDFSIALHSLLCVEFFKDEQKVNSQFIANSVGVNAVTIRGILSKLKAAGIIETKQGTSGIRLCRSPKKITLFEIYKAVEADKNPVMNFHENPNKKCPVGKNIRTALEGVLDSVAAALEKTLKQKTLDALFFEIQGNAKK